MKCYTTAVLQRKVSLNFKSTHTINSLAAQRTIALTDANYANLPIVSGSITLS
ncbi:hypothetical protein [Caproiciproducens sp.]|uniref:hypothetical protein n=1 Tax=Caproiciproducens sp. TaxID=1954376 RepID=UPI0028A104C6|nr:hypothetical protein [Caproiciproducens sp.]